MRKRWHRWQDNHAIRVRVARAMSIPTSPTRISFHSIKQTTAVWLQTEHIIATNRLNLCARDSEMSSTSVRPASQKNTRNCYCSVTKKSICKYTLSTGLGLICIQFMLIWFLLHNSIVQHEFRTISGHIWWRYNQIITMMGHIISWDLALTASLHLSTQCIWKDRDNPTGFNSRMAHTCHFVLIGTTWKRGEEYL